MPGGATGTGEAPKLDASPLWPDGDTMTLLDQMGNRHLGPGLMIRLHSAHLTILWLSAIQHHRWHLYLVQKGINRVQTTDRRRKNQAAHLTTSKEIEVRQIRFGLILGAGK